MQKSNCIIIKEDKTIEEIAVEYQLTVDEILEANPNIKNNQLSKGDELCLPLPNCPIGSTPYEIKKGDTLSSIAVIFFTTAEQLLKYNPDIDPLNLSEGQVICIFEETPKVPKCPSMNIYVINSGDTLNSISQQFGTTVSQLIEINPDIDPYNLSVDEVICLPLIPTALQNLSIPTQNYLLGRFCPKGITPLI